MASSGQALSIPLPEPDDGRGVPSAIRRSFVFAGVGLLYLVYVLEILKFRRFVRHREPERSDAEVDAEVRRSLETGEFEAVSRQ